MARRNFLVKAARRRPTPAVVPSLLPGGGDDIRPLCISARVLAANAGREIVVRLHFQIIFLLFLHKRFALADSPAAHR